MLTLFALPRLDFAKTTQLLHSPSVPLLRGATIQTDSLRPVYR